MIEVKVEGEGQLTVYLEKLTGGILRAAGRVVERQSGLMTEYIKARHLGGGTSADRLAVRTGHMRRTTGPKRVAVRGKDIEGGVQFGAPYARVHVGRRGKETAISPKRARWLTIPLRAALTPAGGPRGSAGDFPDTFFFRSRAGNLLLGQKTGKGGLVPLFVLKKEVIVPARVHPEDIVRVFAPRVKKDLEAELARAL